MKKLIISSFFTLYLAGAIVAQPSVRIGNLEFTFKKSGQDTIVQISVIDNVLTSIKNKPEPDKKPEPVTRERFRRYNHSSVLMGGGFILPDNGSEFFTTLGGSSISIDFGGIRRSQISRRFALGATYMYSFSNYGLQNAAENPKFKDEVIGDRHIVDISKEVYRSHNLALGFFTRFYLMAPKKRNDGVFIDLGAQGDYAFNRSYKVTALEGGRKFSDGDEYFSNPFYASAVARLGGIWLWNTKNSHALFVRYRFTDALKQNVLQMDMPPITIGIHFHP